jgi:hypothetical protein
VSEDGGKTGTPLATAAWILIGTTRSTPGVLVHDGGRLAFFDRKGAIFDVPVEEVSAVVFPWYYFGGGCKLRAGEHAVRLSFVRPNGAPDLTESDLAAARDLVLTGFRGAGQLLGAANSVMDIRKGREATRQWRQVLTDLPAASP